MDAIQYYSSQIEELTQKVRATNWLMNFFLLQWFFGPVLLTLDTNCLQFSSLSQVVALLLIWYLMSQAQMSFALFPFQAEAERLVILDDPKRTMAAAFVSFKSRWGAAVCAQTQQNSNPTVWLTQWAPEPRDINWKNLAIPYMQLTCRRVFVNIGVFLLVFFFLVPVALVQSLASLTGIQSTFPWLSKVLQQ